MIDGKNFCDQPVKYDKVTYKNIRETVIGQRNDYTTGCLLDYIYFKNYYKIIAVDLSKQQALDDGPKANFFMFMVIYIYNDIKIKLTK